MQSRDGPTKSIWTGSQVDSMRKRIPTDCRERVVAEQYDLPAEWFGIEADVRFCTKTAILTVLPTCPS